MLEKGMFMIQLTVVTANPFSFIWHLPALSTDAPWNLLWFIFNIHTTDVALIPVTNDMIYLAPQYW